MYIVARARVPHARRLSVRRLDTIQGVPLGLTFGSVPFMLQSSSSYTDIGVFSFASYPYSLKLLWSPVVDSVFAPDKSPPVSVVPRSCQG